MGIHYPRAFETTFPVQRPRQVPRFSPNRGPLAEQGKQGNAWVGSTDGWRLAKGYSYDWPGRGLKRHAVPAPYLRRLLYWWLAAVEGGERAEQTTLVAGSGTRNHCDVQAGTDRSEERDDR